MKDVRDKTHFHIDPEFIEMGRAWKKADVTGNELREALIVAISALLRIRKALTGANDEDWSFDGRQVAPVVNLCRELSST